MLLGSGTPEHSGIFPQEPRSYRERLLPGVANARQVLGPPLPGLDVHYAVGCQSKADPCLLYIAPYFLGFIYAFL